MNPRESKFILRVHRADGRYAPDDPLFAEALQEVDRTPELAVWLELEHALDATVANKLDGIQPPVGLRETILAGARASRLGRRWWQQPWGLAAAAAVAFVGALVPSLLSRLRHPPLEHALVEFALQDAANPNHHGSSSDAAQALSESLEDQARPLTGGTTPDFETMRQAGCKRFTIAGREVFEVCVARDGRWFHLYAARRPERPAPPPGPVTITERGAVVLASWSTDTTLYVLAGTSGQGALRKLI